jgi:hypothetical protein
MNDNCYAEVSARSHKTAIGEQSSERDFAVSRWCPKKKIIIVLQPQRRSYCLFIQRFDNEL